MVDRGNNGIIHFTSRINFNINKILKDDFNITNKR